MVAHTCRLKLEDVARSGPACTTYFQASLGCIERPCFKQNNHKTNKILISLYASKEKPMNGNEFH